MAFKNCAHKLLHLTHDSNNNRRDGERKKERKMANVDTNTTTNNNKQQPELPQRQSHRERERERQRETETETRSTAHITSPYKSSTTQLYLLSHMHVCYSNNNNNTFVAAKICAQIEGGGDGDSEEICWFFFL